MLGIIFAGVVNTAVLCLFFLYQTIDNMLISLYYLCK